jgi:hypothetical protein
MSWRPEIDECVPTIAPQIMRKDKAVHITAAHKAEINASNVVNDVMNVRLRVSLIDGLALIGCWPYICLLSRTRSRRPQNAVQ